MHPAGSAILIRQIRYQDRRIIPLRRVKNAKAFLKLPVHLNREQKADKLCTVKMQ